MVIDNVLTLTILAGIFIVLVCSIIASYGKAKEEMNSEMLDTVIMLETIQEQLIIAFNSAMQLKNANELGFEGIKEYVFDNLEDYIKESEFLLPADKEFLNRDFLENSLTSLLQNLYSLKLEDPNRTLTSEENNKEE